MHFRTTAIVKGRLLRVDLLDPVDTFIQCAIHRRSNGKRTANDGAETDEEAGEGLVADFAVDDLHGRDVLSYILVRSLRIQEVVDLHKRRRHPEYHP
jgi:hypothetical protein